MGMTPGIRFYNFIQERHNIYLRRTSGQQAPWTKDPILGQYRFCNMYRQLDKVSVALNKQFYPWVVPAMLPFAAIVARLINHPETLLELLKHGMFPGTEGTKWRPDIFVSTLNRRKEAGQLIRNTAYIVSTNGLAMPFPEYIVKHVLNPIWEERAKLVFWSAETLLKYHTRLTSFNGLGSFLAGQVIADLKYIYPDMQNVADWESFAVPGPGSKRGLNRLNGLPYDKAMSDKVFAELFPLAMTISGNVTFDNNWEPLDGQDTQNCLCEFDKYERARTGVGTPKQRYTPPGGTQDLFTP